MLCVFKAGSGFLFKKQLVPDPHREKRLDPDPQKMNADPQPSFILYIFIILLDFLLCPVTFTNIVSVI